MRIIGGSWLDEPRDQNIGGLTPSYPQSRHLFRREGHTHNTQHSYTECSFHWRPALLTDWLFADQSRPRPN